MEDKDADEAIETAQLFEAKPTLEDMILIVGDDMHTVWGSQRARLIADMIDKPMPEMMRRLAVYRALKAFLERIKYQPADVARRLTSKKQDANAEA